MLVFPNQGPIIKMYLFLTLKLHEYFFLIENVGSSFPNKAIDACLKRKDHTDKGEGLFGKDFIQLSRQQHVGKRELYFFALFEHW